MALPPKATNEETGSISLERIDFRYIEKLRVNLLMVPQSRDTLSLQVFQAGKGLGREKANFVSKGEKGVLN